MKNRVVVYIVCFVVAAFALVSCGEGAFKRIVTISGIYSICKPDDYPVVCFLDADGKQGGLFCMPLSEAGGVCKGEKPPSETPEE